MPMTPEEKIERLREALQDVVFIFKGSTVKGTQGDAAIAFAKATLRKTFDT